MAGGGQERKLSDEMLMHLVLLPLTYKGKKQKQAAIVECVKLATRIENKKQETFVLAGILSFTDKVISRETSQLIKEMIGMTQVGKMLMDEGREAGRREGREAGRKEGRKEGRRKGRQEGDMRRAKKTALNMLNRGDSLESIARILELPVEMIESWQQESCAAV